jgi:hypothetical protein
VSLEGRKNGVGEERNDLRRKRQGECCSDMGSEQAAVTREGGGTRDRGGERRSDARGRREGQAEE